MHARGLNLARVHLDVVKDPANDTPSLPGSVTMLRVLVQPTVNASAYADLNSEEWLQLNKDAKRLKWLSDQTLDLGLTKHPFLGLERAEIITAYSAMLHGPLSKINSFAYSRENIYSIATQRQNIQHSAQIADLFLAKFNYKQPLAETELSARTSALRANLNTIEDSARSRLRWST